jgi:hypothetical protein
MSKPKDLYLGYFQARKRMYIERCMAHSEKQAKLLICKRISKEAGVPLNLVMDWFSNPENYSLKIEVKYEEIDQ